MLAIIILTALVASTAVQPIARQQPPTSSTVAKPEQPWPPPGVFKAGKGAEDMTMPRLTRETKPRYTAAAIQAKIEGNVTMEAVVGTDGRIGAVRVTQSLDSQYGLDEEAIKAVKQWRFEPGKKAGVAVPVLVEIEMTFTLRK